MKKTDLRVIKTKKMLYQALISLLTKKSFDKIKITDICQEALINRSTFYAHYDDKYDLLEDLFESERLDFLISADDDGKSSLTKESLLRLTSLFIDMLDENRDKFNAILFHDGNNILWKYFVDLYEKNIIKRINKNDDIINSIIPAEIVVKFYSSGIINLLYYYMTHDVSKEDLMKYYDILIPKILKG